MRAGRVTNTPVRSSPSAGIFALAFRDTQNGFAVGGDFASRSPAPDAPRADARRRPELGARHRRAERVPLGRALGERPLAIVVGPTGSDATFDRGRSWEPFDEGSFDTVDCVKHEACWASASMGRVAYLTRD